MRWSYAWVAISRWAVMLATINLWGWFLDRNYSVLEINSLVGLGMIILLTADAVEIKEELRK